ncbi:kinase-like domain-containing protein [Russula dissimulans]|nr:kinase-like domain-containing protein [Russula dissimulans]
MNTRQAGTLVASEEWWRDHYNDIESHGYRLRPRYHPRWEPSWITSKKHFFAVEDGQPTITRAVMDAVRTRDNLPVMLKRVFTNEGPHELSITQRFSSPELARDPRNHCVLLLDVIELPMESSAGSHKVMVFPLLRPFNSPRFQTFGELIAFFTQICEGLQFMHERNVAHRDCTANNIMFDPSWMYPEGFHPVKIDRKRTFKGKATAYTRTQRPPRYILIDFGLSRQYTTREAMDHPLRGGDKTAPEHRSKRLSNPFHTDIYYLGNLMREHFIKRYRGFRFMEDLVDAMTNPNPADRPRIEDVIQRFNEARRSLSQIKLWSAITSKMAPWIVRATQEQRQNVRTIQYIISRKAAIPDP